MYTSCMAAIGAGHLTAGLSSALRQELAWTSGRLSPNRSFTPLPALSTEQPHVSRSHTVKAEPEKPFEDNDDLSLKDYFEQSKNLIISDGGPPRWFSPLECAFRMENSPLLLFLPGIDGVGLGLILHYQKLGKIFDVWCLHIPVMDRTPFTELVLLVERTIKSENSRMPNRPIYVVGECFGGCLALAVAARNQDVDLVLILANPATSFRRSQLQLLTPLVEIMPDQLGLRLPFILSLMTGGPLKKAMTSLEKGLPLQQTVEELMQGLVMDDVLPRETLLWKLELLKTASSYANSRLHAVKAQTLILSSARDQLLPSEDEGERLRRTLPKCEIRRFNDSGHFLFLDDAVDLVTTIKGASFYRRGKSVDYALDYIPPTPDELKRAFEPHRWIDVATAPVILSTMEDGKIVKGLSGVPSEGPVILVGYHMLLGVELIPLSSSFVFEKNIILRGMAHPMLFEKLREGKMPDVSAFDTMRVMGAVPVSATNFYRLLLSKSHILLYPGGVREALHRKGEEYKLFWPEQSEFVRMAARFGAKIVPFGVVGEDDIFELLLDYDDFVKIPYLKAQIEELTNEVVQLRADIGGEVANQAVYFPGVLPKLPGRFYFLFGKPIETEGNELELRDREKARELYYHVKSEVENCISYLKEKRQSDPYRNLLQRLIYHAQQGFTSEVPTFEL